MFSSFQEDKQIQNLQDTIEQMKSQLPNKSLHIPTEHCDDAEVTIQPLTRENGSEKPWFIIKKRKKFNLLY